MCSIPLVCLMIQDRGHRTQDGSAERQSGVSDVIKLLLRLPSLFSSFSSLDVLLIVLVCTVNARYQALRLRAKLMAGKACNLLGRQSMQGSAG